MIMSLKLSLKMSLKNEFEDFKGKGWGYVLSTGITLQGFITSESGNQILQFQKKNRAIDSVLTWILSTFKDQITTVKT